MKKVFSLIILTLVFTTVLSATAFAMTTLPESAYPYTQEYELIHATRYMPAEINSPGYKCVAVERRYYYEALATGKGEITAEPFERHVYTSDANGNVTKIARHVGTKYVQTSTYEYDNAGNLVAKGTSAKYKYDGAGNLVRLELWGNPEYEMVGYYTFEYNSDGTLSKFSVYDMSGKLDSDIMYEYDNRGNLVYEYKEYSTREGKWNPIYYQYSENNQLIKMESYNMATSLYFYEYNTDGTLAKETQNIQGRYGESTRELVYNYTTINGQPRCVSYKCDDGSAVQYQYDSIGNLKQITSYDKDGKKDYEADYKAVKTANKPETVAGFSDVYADSYYADAVKWAVEKNITSGTSATTFSPNTACTRAQAVTFLWRAAGQPEPKGDATFADVQPGSYYDKAVRWAVEKGITSGTGNGKFSPDEVCSRAQIVTLLYRFEGSPVASGGSFSDVPTSAYYADAVAWGVSKGITSGTGDGKFSPNTNCTRAQIVTLLYRDMGSK